MGWLFLPYFYIIYSLFIAYFYIIYTDPEICGLTIPEPPQPVQAKLESRGKRTYYVIAALAPDEKHDDNDDDEKILEKINKDTKFLFTENILGITYK